MQDDLNKIDDLFIMTNGSFKSVKPYDGICYSEDQIINLVGVNFKLINYGQMIIVCCDDKLYNKKAPFNLLAYLVTNRYICGNVLICLKERILNNFI